MFGTPTLKQALPPSWAGPWKIGCALVLFASTLKADDWPAYRGGMARHGYVHEQVENNYSIAWTFSTGLPPKPAWPAPATRSYWQRLESILPRVTDDAAFHPVVANGHVYFGSSSDDHLYCLDINTGQLVWTFCTDGPVRYAPCVTESGVYFGSDDGLLYCLDPERGHLQWSRRIVEEDRRIPGNERIISTWPVRTGCVVQDGSVFATAGLFPEQGAFAASFEAQSGKLIWKQKLQNSPQGYLLASSKLLYVPTGRSNPVALDLLTGETKKQFTGVGGTFGVIVDDALIAGRGNDGTLEISEADSAERIIQIKGTELAITPKTSIFYDQPNLSIIDRKKHHALSRSIRNTTSEINELQRRLNKSEANSTEARAIRNKSIQLTKQIDQAKQDLLECLLLKIEIDDCTALLASQQKIIVGRKNGLDIYGQSDGTKLFTHPVNGSVLGLAYSNGHIIASTDKGEMIGFAQNLPNLSDGLKSENRLNHALPKTKGYAVMIGIPSETVLASMMESTRNQWIVIDSEQQAIDTFRKKLLTKRQYGHFITAHRIPSGKLPFTHYIANIIQIMPGSENKYPREELKRLLRPHGGILTGVDGKVRFRQEGLKGEGYWTHLYGNAGNTGHSGDQWTDSELKIQWFGGPGPRRMVDRHLRGPAPLFHQGTMVIPGENTLISIDPYHGGELWQLDLPSSQRYSMPYDAGYMSLSHGHLAIAVNDACWMVNASSGSIQSKIPLPTESQEKHWGYVSLNHHQLIGSIQKSTASRTVPGYDQIDQDYRNGQPLVTSDAVFSMNVDEQHLDWVYRGGTIINPTITMSEESLYFIECNQSSTHLKHRTGRIPLADCFQDGADLVALSLKTGKPMWRQPLPDHLLKSRNIIYLQSHSNRLIACGSYLNQKNDTTYLVTCFDATNGTQVWEASHEKGKPGQSFHGEQLHHPVVMDPYLITEPVIYQLSDGKPINAPNESDKTWVLNRPGHSCGTLSAGGDCLFFRATNPTVMDLSENLQNNQSPIKLSPSRTGCWINIIPAGGLVMIPEASAGCVCHFSLQTSMAFLPKSIWGKEK